jgi:hypothetical protein
VASPLVLKARFGLLPTAPPLLAGDETACKLGGEIERHLKARSCGEHVQMDEGFDIEARKLQEEVFLNEPAL